MRVTEHPVTDNVIVLGALGILAYAASMMTHEAPPGYWRPRQSSPAS
jgi:hypothetical protein